MKGQSGGWKAVALLVAVWIRLLGGLVRWRTEVPDSTRAILRGSDPIILAFWHGRLLMIPVAYLRWGRQHLNVLISEHRDGELIAQAIGRFGFEAIRGSSRRRPLRGLRELLRRAGKGIDFALTPDGPRGPAYRAQPGVVDLARRTGYPILPVSYGTRGGWQLASWDRFLLPRPLTSGVFCWGEPQWVDPEQDRERARQNLEGQLRALTEQADRLTGRSS